MVERSGDELERILGKQIVQFALEGGKVIEKKPISRIELSESVSDNRDYGPL